MKFHAKSVFFRCICIAAAAVLMLPLAACKDSQAESSALSGEQSTVSDSAEHTEAADRSESDSTGSTSAAPESSTADSPKQTTASAAETGSSAAENTQSGTQTSASADAQSGTVTTAVTEKIGKKPTVYADNITAKAGQQRVPVTVNVANNPGMSFLGIRVYYDSALSPVFDKEPLVQYENGTVTKSLVSTCAANKKKQIVGYSTFASADLKSDGSLFTCYFDVPADAAAGTVYRFRLEAADITNTLGKPVSFGFRDFTLTVR